MDVSIVADLALAHCTSPRWPASGAPGCWYAMRGCPEHPGGPRSLPRSSLSAPDLVAVAHKLSRQELPGGSGSGKLAGVWRRGRLPWSTQREAS